MKNTINTSKKGILFGAIFSAILSIALLGTEHANAAIYASLDVGATGSQVTELQTYLATNASIYPSGLVTGFFGPLTQAAVQRFQTAQGIVSAGTPATTGYGRVGPMTMLRINALMGGSAPQAYWDGVPVLTNPLVQTTSNSATFTWTSNESTQGQVYLDTIPLRSDEATGPNQIPYVSGALSTDGVFGTNHSITVQNLSSNTTYYFLTRGIDSGNNVTMIWPRTFRTN